MKSLLVFMLVLGITFSIKAQESPEACNARSAIIKQQNQNSTTKKELPVCTKAPSVLHSGTSSLNGKVVGGYTTYSNGVTVHTANGVTRTCINEVCN